MKECRYCNESYPENYFGVSLTTKKKVYRRHKCRFCYHKAKKVLLESHKRWVDEYKKGIKCSFCGMSDYRVIDFHHKGDEKKDFGISAGLAEKLGLERIKKEIDKCIPLCANCHRIVHFKGN